MEINVKEEIKGGIDVPKKKLIEKLLGRGSQDLDFSNLENGLNGELEEKDDHESIEKVDNHVEKKPPEGRVSNVFNNIFSSATALVNPNPFEDSEDVKVKFNQLVSSLANYYLKDNEISFFYFSQFLETVLIHLIYFILGPISAPFLFCIYGRNFIINMGFWGKKLKFSHIIQIFYWMSFVITVILTIIISKSDSSSLLYNQFIFLGPAYIAQIMIFIRYMTVSVKYGFFPPDYYNKLKNVTIVTTEVKSNFLLQGWIKPNLLVLDVYLKEIFKKFNIDVDKFNFQCLGKLTTSLKTDFDEVDKIISQDASKIRQSYFRRINKKDNFKNIVNGAMENLNVYDKAREKLKSSETYGTELKEIYNLTLISIEERTPKMILKFRKFFDEKMLPFVRNKMKEEKDKVIHKNEYVYEINGYYLCRAILKNVYTESLNFYVVLHKIFVTILVVTPFFFTYIYTSDLLKTIVSPPDRAVLDLQPFSNSTIQNITLAGELDTNSKIVPPQLYVNVLSYIFLLFSLVAMIPPTWLNTLNLIYGMIDLRRRRTLMFIVTEIFDGNVTSENRIYPLINTLHAKTLINWYSLRSIFMAYGKRFTDRILLQTSIFCLFVVISIIICILALLGFFKHSVSMVLFINILEHRSLFYFLNCTKFNNYHHYDDYGC